MGVSIGSVSIAIDPEVFSYQANPLGSQRELLDGRVLIQIGAKSIKLLSIEGTCTESEASGLRSLGSSPSSRFTVTHYNESYSNCILNIGSNPLSLDTIKGSSLYKYRVSLRVL